MTRNQALAAILCGLFAAVAIAFGLLVLYAGPAGALEGNCAPTCADPSPKAAMVTGCGVLAHGWVGIDDLSGNVGEIVTVNVPLGAVGRIDAYMIDLIFPGDVVEFVSASRGDLVADFQGFNFQAFPWEGNSSGVRFLAWGGAAFVEQGEVGTIAVLEFRVIAPGCGPFCFLYLWDDIEAYDTCSEGGPLSTSAPDVDPSWGELKADFR